jgi:hypothetical protein
MRTGSFPNSTSVISNLAGTVCAVNGVSSAGYCSSSLQCVAVDNNQLLNNLSNLFPQSVQAAIEWIRNNWYWVLLAILGLIVVAVGGTYAYRRRHPARRQRDVEKRRNDELAQRGHAPRPADSGARNKVHPVVDPMRSKEQGASAASV